MRALTVELCPKLVVVDEGRDALLLCRRHGEEDLDGHFSFVGGKLEEDDQSLLSGIAREIREELGGSVRLDVLLPFSVDVLFTKSSGVRMTLPHFYARYVGGELALNAEEYSEARWVPFAEIERVRPLVGNIPAIARQLKAIRQASCVGRFEPVE